MKTIKDIAELSGYSVGTVSRVINNHPDVSPSTRAKIEEIIAEHKFQPNSNARLLKGNAGSAIAILVKGTTNVFFESILEKMQNIFKSSGEDISVMFLDERSNEVETAIQVCAERKPKGIVFLGGNLKYFRERFSEITIPCVLVTVDASDLPFENLSSFTVNDISGAEDAVGYLIRNGHRKIGIVGGSLNTDDGQVSSLRLTGALKKLEENGIGFSDEDYEPSRFSMAEGYAAAKKLLKKNRGLTGIFALSDTLAIGVIRAAADLGLKVPDDLSVIGYDGIQYSRYSSPRIATVEQDVDALAGKSVQDLLLRISYSRPAVHEQVIYHVITGESIKDLT